MRNPTKVTKETISPERGSSRSEKSTENFPAEVQGAIHSTTGVPGPEKNGMSRAHAATVARPTEPTPAAETKDFPRRGPSRRQRRKPASGSAGMTHRRSVTFRSPFQQV